VIGVVLGLVAPPATTWSGLLFNTSATDRCLCSLAALLLAMAALALCSG
jgi:hypothetical protein